MQVFSIKRTHLLLFCLILISCQIEDKTNLAQNYQCEITNSVDYLIEMHQFDQTNFGIITSNTSILELKTNDIFNFQGNFGHLLSKFEMNMMFKFHEEIKFLENNEQNYEEMNIQELVFEINPQERLYFYIMSFSSSGQDVQVMYNQSDILISFNKNIQSDVNVQLIFAAPNQINIPILNSRCKEDNCKKKPLYGSFLIGLQQSQFMAQSIQSAQYSVNSYLFNYHRYSNIYLSRIISQNITQHLSLSECEFENRLENLVNQIELEVNQYKCLKNKIASKVISLKMSKNYKFPSQLHLLMAFEIPLGINLEQIILNLVQNFQQINCNQIYEKPKYLLINAAFVQIQQISMESESQFEKYNEEKQIQQEKTTPDIIIQPFQNFVISDEETQENIEDYITNNIDQKPIYKTLNGIYTPQVPDLYEQEIIVENKEEIDQNIENKVEQEVVDQQSLIQKEEEPEKETSDFIIYEDPISWNENGQQEVEVFSLEENNQNILPQLTTQQNQPDTMIIEQAKVEEVNFDEIPTSQIIQPETVVQTIPNQEQQIVQQEDQKQNDKAQDQKEPYDSDYSDYYEYSEDYDNYDRHLHHNHQLKHNFHHHQYDYTEQYKNNLRTRKTHHDTLPIVADRIIIEYNFANKLKEEKIKMHGDDEVEEEEKEEENENIVQQTKKPKSQKGTKLDNEEEPKYEEKEEKQLKKRQQRQNEPQEDQLDAKKQSAQQKKQKQSLQEDEPINQDKEEKQPKKRQKTEEEDEPEEDQQAPKKQQTQPKKQKQPQKEEDEEEPEQEDEEVPKKKSNAQPPQKQKAKSTDLEEEEEVEEKPKKQKGKAPQKEEDEENQDEEPKPKKKQAAKKQEDEEENDEIQDEGGNAEKEEEEIQQDEASPKKKKSKKQVEEDEEECENDEQEKEEKEEQNNDEAQQDEAENEQDECHCEKKKKQQEEEEKDEGEQEAKKDKKKKKGKKKDEEEEGQYDYYGRYVRNHPYFERRNRYINKRQNPMDEDMYWRYQNMNRQVRNQGYPFNWNPYQHRRHQIEANVFHRMNPYRFTPNSGFSPNSGFTPNVGQTPNMIRQRYCNQGMPTYRGASQEQTLRELAYKHAQQQYAKQQVKQYRDQVGYFNCYGQDYYRPEYYESYQGAIQDDPRYQVINRNINDPNVFSPFDESLYYRNAQPQNIYHNNMAQQNIKIQQQSNNDTSCFQVFDQCNFQGKSINLCGENPMLPQDLNGFKIFSYIVPQNLEIKFSQPKENQGELSTLEGSQECLQSPYQLIPHNS